MLVLTRKVGESILIDGGIRITVTEVHGQRVRLGIQAPEDVTVLREELAAFRNWDGESQPTEEQVTVSLGERAMNTCSSG